jgi:hypothetical protein
MLFSTTVVSLALAASHAAAATTQVMVGQGGFVFVPDT